MTAADIPPDVMERIEKHIAVIVDARFSDGLMKIAIPPVKTQGNGNIRCPRCNGYMVCGCCP